VSAVVNKRWPLADEAQKTLTILGSTGTIGQNTLKIVAAHPGKFRIQALTAANNVAALAEQAKKFKPARAVIANESLYSELKTALAGTGIDVAAGDAAMCEAAEMGADVVMSAIVGAAALKPTLAAIKAGHTVALANKECLVSAGELVKKEAAKYGATLIPVDSEHSAIFQVFDPAHPVFVESVTITASGGPFRNFTREQMANVTPEQAVKHPNWAMGAKISVDSATLMNKGLELIEAFYLFPLACEQLKVLIHPQSIVHAFVHMIDGSVLAQLSHPDMCTPIAYALAWPERIATPVKKLNFAEIGSLTFETPDLTTFPALALAQNALKTGGSAPTVLNAANEIAVGRFLKNDIKFLDIATHVEKTLEKMPHSALNSMEDVFACDDAARRFAKEL
jgi:1-deoxy-D-xylulose-5-phosphate reductoisomerase